jgi:hypothetical protein
MTAAVVVMAHDLAFSRQLASELLPMLSLQKSEGAGNAGRALAPAVSCAEGEEGRA